jgi:DNA-binding response OmpR family regulator
MSLPHVLSVGYDRELIHVRSLVLRSAGFVVDEAHNLQGALCLVQLDSMEVLLLCHTVPRVERGYFIADVREMKPSLPIVCIKAHPHELRVPGCLSVENDPVALLKCLKLAIEFPCWSLY